MEKRIAAGEEWLDAPLDTLKRHLKDLCKQLSNANKPELIGGASARSAG